MNRRIEVRMGRTINTGNFEGTRIDFGIAEDIPDDADINDCFDGLLNTIEDRLDEEEAAILENAV